MVRLSLLLRDYAAAVNNFSTISEIWDLHFVNLHWPSGLFSSQRMIECYEPRLLNAWRPLRRSQLKEKNTFIAKFYDQLAAKVFVSYIIHNCWIFGLNDNMRHFR